MTLSFGRDIFMTPGPSIMPDTVLNAMHRAAPNIYEGELVDMTRSIFADLKTIVGTNGHGVVYICNGHGVWEAALSNVLQQGDKTLNPATGSFAHGWADLARKMGFCPEIMEFGKSRGMEPAKIETRLREDKSHEIKAIMITHTDTSSGLRNDIVAVRAAMDAAAHPALLLVDCVASIGCERFEMDVWGVDVVVTASQKGLMTPPGLGYVFFNDKAAKIADATPKTSPYWDWAPRVKAEFFYHQFSGTAPTHHLFGQRAALDMIMAEGIGNVWNRHAVFARAIWAAVETWGSDGPLYLNVKNPARRSNAVTTILSDGFNCTPLRQWCEEKAGLTLGLLIGFDNYDNGFRIGHMGHLNPPMVLGALATIDAGLKALDIPHGDGALTAASRIIANS